MRNVSIFIVPNNVDIIKIIAHKTTNPVVLPLFIFNIKCENIYKKIIILLL